MCFCFECIISLDSLKWSLHYKATVDSTACLLNALMLHIKSQLVHNLLWRNHLMPKLPSLTFDNLQFSMVEKKQIFRDLIIYCLVFKRMIYIYLLPQGPPKTSKYFFFLPLFKIILTKQAGTMKQNEPRPHFMSDCGEGCVYSTTHKSTSW